MSMFRESTVGGGGVVGGGGTHGTEVAIVVERQAGRVRWRKYGRGER